MSEKYKSRLLVNDLKSNTSDINKNYFTRKRKEKKICFLEV